MGTVETKWYEFRQNNSRGVYTLPAQVVVVEGTDEEHAFRRFMDTDPPTWFCRCCGERWSGYSRSEHTDRPKLSEISGPYRREKRIPWVAFMPISGPVETVAWDEGGNDGQ